MSTEQPERWTKGTVFKDMWVDPDDDPRDTGISLTDERSTLLDYLRAYRITLEMKCSDLSPSQMATKSVPPSTMSLLGLIRHIADVERYWFRTTMAGQPEDKHYPGGSSWDVDGADAAMVATAWQHWRDEVNFAQQLIERTPDLSTEGTMRDGSKLQLREVLIHMIEEYARHSGHADLLRERVDGRVGQ